MSWRDIPEYLKDLDVGAVSDWTACFAEFTTELNGRIDRDNIGYRLVTNAKVVMNSTDRYLYVVQAAPVQMRPTAPGSASELTVLMTGNIDAEEWLVVRASGYVTRRGADATKIEFFLAVDNVIVCVLEPMRLSADTEPKAYEMECAIPVVGGLHRIDVLASATRYYRNTTATIGADAEKGSLVVMERRR